MASQEDAKIGRKRRSDGERTHAAILETATRLASIEGIEGLTIGRLAAELGISKSGVYAHFDSKEQLQLQTIQRAQAIFDEEVMVPAMRTPEGIRRFEAIVEAFFSYLERWVFPGGCFFASLLAEVGPQSGPIHDAIAAYERTTQAEMAELLREGQRRGELDDRIDPLQLAFEIYANMELANYYFVLFRDPEVLERGRRAVKDILERAGGGTREPEAQIT